MGEPQPDFYSPVKSSPKRKRAAGTDKNGDAHKIDYLHLHFDEVPETDEKGRKKIVWRCRKCNYEYRPQTAGNTTDQEWWRSSMPGKHWKKHPTNDGNEDNDEANKCEEQVDSEGGDADKVRPLMRSNCRLRQANLCLPGEDCRQCWCNGAPRGVPAMFAHRRYAAISLAKVVPLNVLAASSSTETRTRLVNNVIGPFPVP